MAMFGVHGRVTVSCFTLVEAETKEEAWKIAEQRYLSGLTYNAHTGEEAEEWHIETDGEPEVMHVEKL